MAERKAFIGALKTTYFLNKREIAHTTNFMPLLDLGKSLGATYLNDMHIGGNASYTSERTMQELVRALGKTVSMEIYQQLQMSPLFTLCVDETADVSVTKQLIVYGRYVCNGDGKTSFLGILELQNGLAVTITEALCKLCSNLKVDL